MKANPCHSRHWYYGEWRRRRYDADHDGWHAARPKINGRYVLVTWANLTKRKGLA